jgi:hypothetical protein
MMSGLNRVLLTVIGLLTLAVGISVVALSGGFARPAVRSVGLDVPVAPPTNPVWPGWNLGGSTTLVIVLVSALVLALLAVLWLLGQLPARHATRDLRLDARGLPGTVIVDPRAVEAAVEEQLLGRLGVTGARVDLRGAAAEPQVFIRLAAEERADLPGIMAFVHTTVADDLSTALQVPLDRLGLTLDLASQRRGDSSVRIESPAVVAGGR